MSLILDLIKTEPNWRNILNNKEIKITEKGDLASFNYNHSADFHDPVVREARGIIIDLKNEKVVCFPFRKFGNYMEEYVDSIDWSTAKAQEKVDGSIMKAYFYDGKWCIASNATIDAFDAPAGTSDKTFGELFSIAAERQGLDWDRLDKDCTYIFELTSKEALVVIDYGDTPQIWHLGTRNNITEEELDTNIGIKKPKQYPLKSLDDCIKAAEELNDETSRVQEEGFVVVDKDYHRIKVKSPYYVLVHSVLPNGMVSDKTLIECIKNGASDDIVYYRKDIAPRIEHLKEAMRDIDNRLDHYYRYWKRQIGREHLTKKQFAAREEKSPYFPFCVAALYNPDGYVQSAMQMRTSKLVQLIHSRPELTVMVGLPGSGKSHYAKQQKGVLVVSSDDIRKELLGSEDDQSNNAEVFKIYSKRIREAIIGGRSVIADATNISMKSRKTVAPMMKLAHHSKTIVMATPVHACLKNDENRSRSVGPLVIYKMLKAFEPPIRQEGFDEIIFIKTPDKPFTEKVLDDILAVMDGFDQTSKWHTEDLRTHSIEAALHFVEKHRDPVDRVAALLHDIGKLRVRTYDENGAHFYNHGNIGAYDIMSRYDFPMYSDEDFQKLLMLVCFHDKIINMKPQTIENMFGHEYAEYLKDFRNADIKASKRMSPIQAKEMI